MFSLFGPAPGLHELGDPVGLGQQSPVCVAIEDPLNWFLGKSNTAYDYDQGRSHIPRKHTERLYSLAGP